MSHVEASRGAQERNQMLGEGSSQEDIREVGATGRHTHTRSNTLSSAFPPSSSSSSSSSSCRFARCNLGSSGSLRTSGLCAETGESSCLHSREREVCFRTFQDSFFVKDPIRI